MFDQRAKTWDSDPLKTERAETVAQAIQRSVPLNLQMTALEYGCGTGLLSFALRPWLGHITLADTSQGMLDVLAAKIEAAGATDMTSLRLDLCADPLPNTRFNLAYSLMTLHHIPDTATILRRFHDVLQPGSWLCIADLDREDGSFHGAGVTDVHRGFEREGLQCMTETAGFTDVRFETVFEMRKEVAGRVRTFPLFLLVAKKEQK